MNQSIVSRFLQSRTWSAGLLALGLWLPCACSSLPEAVNPEYGEFKRESAASYLEQARSDLEENRLLRAAQVLIELRKTRGLVPEDLYEADRLLNDAAERLFAQVQQNGGGSESMRQLYGLELPLRLRASAGLLMAQELFNEGHPVLCYRAVAEVESRLPNHPMRQMAAEILARTGSYMLAKGGNYSLLFSYKVKGAAALEFLVERYVTSSYAPKAYAQLARYYESIDELKLAFFRWEALTINHGLDALVPEASSRSPYLRLKQMSRTDYDRSEVLIAVDEINQWLSKYPDLDQAPWMQENLLECREWLALNDLGVARFYKRIKSLDGARLHGDRALVEAKLSGSESTIASIEALLATLPAAEPEAFGVEIEAPVAAQPQTGTR